MFRPVRQRLVRTHPVSGRKSLYLSSHAGAILGMPMPEARILLRDLNEHATQPKFVYVHQWRRGRSRRVGQPPGDAPRAALRRGPAARYAPHHGRGHRGHYRSRLESPPCKLVIYVIAMCLLLTAGPASAEWFADAYVGQSFTLKDDMTVHSPSGLSIYQDTEFDRAVHHRRPLRPLPGRRALSRLRCRPVDLHADDRPATAPHRRMRPVRRLQRRPGRHDRPDRRGRHHGLAGRVASARRS